ncbi:M15 family metallopeptidase [Knoellia subterranea]|uniref:Peptidase M15 n=1 Tax=Knoellia subterranea KCTC 19937 TaxID=1385521 RepID=A0A0A0JJC0_9MICO|nr:M15 family metallopeptidase [Knoellia subterranea]KGN37188.1 peptidase M15 [Knoellia subterranea KCTC 19937]
MIQSPTPPPRLRYPLLTLLTSAVLASATLVALTIWWPLHGNDGAAAQTHTSPPITVDSRPPTVANPVKRATRLQAPPAKPGSSQGNSSTASGVLGDDPSVTNLDPDLLAALRAAAEDAEADGVRIVINSGWRSPEYQAKLLREAVAKYGSEEEAARWVAPPEKSEHVSGDAVDVGPTKATQWLAEHGPAYGLCQIYRNEPWHYELRPQATSQGCPDMYANPTADPRMR